MKVTFIKPGFGDALAGYRLNDGRMEPLQIGILAGLTPPEHDISFYDDRMEPIPYDARADIVAISVDTFNARRAYEISGEFRKRGIPVVLGGVHVTLAPEEAALRADAIVTGDAETAWPGLLIDFSAGRLRPRYEGSFGVPQEHCLPRRDLFRKKGYLPVSLVQFGRGCYYDCSFCSIASFFGRTHRCRPVDDVVREIREQGLRFILFTDDSFTAERRKVLELMDALKPLKVRWACQASVDVCRDAELLERMADSGCIGQLIGFDSIFPDGLQWMRKGPNIGMLDRYQEAVERLRSHGLQTWASFMLGGDCDTPETIEATVRFSIESKFTLAFFHILQPYPGTDLYARLKSEGRLLYGGAWWLDPEFRYNAPTFVPRGMSPGELGRYVVWANREFYGLRSIISRTFEWNTNLGSLSGLLLHLRFNALIRATST
jgi:radical SAM superfamily enzyme YgiQ (UPF0313 family)